MESARPEPTGCDDAALVPARVRPVVAVLGGLGVLAIGCSLLILEQHMLSDVVGGYLIAVLWMALALAALRTAERRRPGASRP